MKTLFKNINVVDVFNHEIKECDVLIDDDKIISIGKIDEIENMVDCKGKYMYPSFIDTHLHFESSQLRPSEYLKLAIAYGTTAFIADPHEITNVCGEDGIKFIKEDIKDIPADIKIMMPSCVPATPLEYNKVKIDADETIRLTKKYDLYGLGEMMDIIGVLNDDKEVLKKIKYFKDNNMIVDGHAPLMSGIFLDKYILAGMYTDHEVFTKEEALERVSKGMTVQIRNGSAAKDVEKVIKAVNKDNISSFVFATDDKEPEELASKGTIIDAVKKAIKSGIDKIDAIKIASLNGYRTYKLEKRGAIAIGYYANFIIAPDLEFNKNLEVYYMGKLVAKDNVSLFEIKNASILNVTSTVNIKKIELEDLKFNFDKSKPVMEIIPGSLITKKIYCKDDKELNRMYSIERHHKTGLIGKCFVKGFNLKNGAIAQTISHDSHNIIALGNDEKDILDVINALKTDGGIAIKVDGKITYLELDIAGLMSSKPYAEVIKKRHELLEATHKLSMNNKINPLMLLSFLSLIVIPDIKLTCNGLYSIIERKYIE